MWTLDGCERYFLTVFSRFILSMYCIVLYCIVLCIMYMSIQPTRLPINWFVACISFFFFRIFPSGVTTADFLYPVVPVFCILLRHFNLSHVLFHHIRKLPFGLPIFLFPSTSFSHISTVFLQMAWLTLRNCIAAVASIVLVFSRARLVLHKLWPACLMSSLAVSLIYFRNKSFADCWSACLMLSVCVLTLFSNGFNASKRLTRYLPCIRAILLPSMGKSVYWP